MPEWLAELVSDLAANRELLAELLARHLPDVGWRPGEATYLAWLDCRALGLGVVTLAQDDLPARRLGPGHLGVLHASHYPSITRS